MKISLFFSILFFSTYLSSQIISTNGLTTGCVPAVFIFKKKSPQSSYNWNLGNGSFSTKDSVSATYTSPGTYTVTEGSNTLTIQIFNKPTVKIDSLSKTFGCLPFSFSLKDKTNLPPGVNALDYKWTFGDGSTASGSTISHTIVNYEPLVDVSLTIYTDIPSCDNTVLLPGYLKTLSLPKTAIKIDSAYTCMTPFTSTISNATTASQYNNLTYTWTSTYPTLNTSNSKDIGPKTYTSNTVDTITLVATNQYGCRDTSKSYVVIDKPVLKIKAPDTFCGEVAPTTFMKIKLLDYNIADDRYEYFVENSQLSFGGRTKDEISIRTLVPKEGWYTYTITKFNKNNPFCKVSETKSVYIIYFVPKLITDSVIQRCHLPIDEYYKATNFSPSVDSISWYFEYQDKYSDIVEINFKTNSPKDSTYHSTLHDYPDKDSFYRKGNFYRVLSLTYYNTKYKCRSSIGFSEYFKKTFYAYLISNRRKGCVPLEISTNILSYSTHHIDSSIIFWGDGTSSTLSKNLFNNYNHTYNTPGNYRIYSIAFDSLGCFDTTNSIWIEAGGDVSTSFYKSKDTLCLGDTLYLKDTSSLDLIDPYFLSEIYETNSCGISDNSYLVMNKKTGWQYIYFYYKYNGCNNRVVDSVYVKGTTFKLNYDYKCQYRDSFTFRLDSLVRNGTDSFLWDFGDGTTLISKDSIVGHKYSKGDYTVQVSNYSIGSFCPNIDSVKINVRNLKAVIRGDTFLCKLNSGSYLSSFNYNLDPLLSVDAEYHGHYTYSWIIKDVKGKVYPIVSHIDSIKVDFPNDTFDLSLVARDINGCADTNTRHMLINETKSDFSLSKPYLCGQNDTLQAFDHSKATIFGIKKFLWIVLNHPTGEVITYNDTSKNPIFNFIGNVIRLSDSLEIKLQIIDSNDCNSSITSKYISVVNDTSKILGKDTICFNTPFKYTCNINNLNNFNYYWYLNNVLIDSNVNSTTLSSLVLGKNKLLLKKVHKATKCVFNINKTILVLPKPKLRIDNTFDTANYRCHPSTTNISAFDTLGLDFHSQWNFNSNSPTFLNPSNFVLNAGINKIVGYFTTDYGCLDSIVNYDTVYDVQAKLQLSKPLACFGDEVTFTLTDLNSVATIYWDFGDGTFDKTNSKVVKHKFVKDQSSVNTYNINCIIAASGNLCAKSLTDSIKIYNIKADFNINNGDSDLCYIPSIPININSPSADKFNWYISNGDKYLNQNLTSLKLPKPGKYYITLYSIKSDLNCVDSITKPLVLYPYPSLKVNSDTTCYGVKAKINFTDTLSKTKVFIIPDVNSKSPYTSSPIVIQLDSSVNLTLIAESEHMCRDTIKQKLPIIIFRPIDTIDFDTIVEANKPVKLPLTLYPQWSYVWDPPLIKPSCQNCNNPEIRYIDSMVHNLTFKDNRGCFTLTNKYIIRIYPQITVQVPTAFTPNGDGNNDILYARGFGIKKLLSFKIYNRTGQLLFFTQDENFGWDGMYKGKMQNSEPYYYTFEAESFVPGKIVTGEGSFMLLR